MASRPRWGDDFDEEEALPPKTETPVDENGIKTIVEYVRDDKGRAIKRTTKVKIASVQQKVYKISDVRKNWPKFGSAVNGNEGVTGKSNDDIPFENVLAEEKTEREVQIEGMKNVLESGDKQSIVGSLKDMLLRRRQERELLRARGELAAPEKPPDEDAPAQPKAGSYVPPSLRNRQPGSTAPEPRRNSENSVRVTNLAEEVTEMDLRELFSPFGQISRVFLALDHETKKSRGFAFINYVRREDAARAIKALNRRGYANLILHCEWATPRAPRPGG